MVLDPETLTLDLEATARLRGSGCGSLNKTDIESPVQTARCPERADGSPGPAPKAAHGRGS
jgi:hypothetical protein